MYKPFHNILKLCAGDLPAKVLNFLTFVYLARVLGVAHYGVLEFSFSIVMYFLLLADGGLELWATREAAQGGDMRQLAARVVPLRFLLATVSFAALFFLLPIFPDYPALTTMLLLCGLSLFAQATNLKWVFMSKERMGRVAGGLLIAQIVFAATVFASVHSPERLIWVPVLRLLADLVMAGYFFLLFTLTYGGFPWPPTLRDASAIVRPALMMGGAQAAGLVSYSFDSLLLGLLSGPAAVGLYNAAYKPVTAALAMPMTYYQGLFPALSRTFATSEDDFHKVIARSLALMSIFAVPLGIVGTFFSEPIINLLFGSAYSNSVPVLQILCWSAVLVTLRGTYRQGLLAAGKTNLDLRCGAISVFFNVGLNILLIPQFGIVGAAIATVSAEAIWLITVAWHFNRFVIRVNLHAVLLRPLAASGLLLGCLIGLQPMFWGLQASIGAVVYLGTLALLNSPGLRGINIFGPAFARED